MKLYKTRSSLSVIMLAAMATHCTSKTTAEEEAKEEEKADIKTELPDVGSLLIQLPSALANSGASLRLTEGDDGLKSLFLIPVNMAGLAGSMTELNKSVLLSIFGKPVCTDEDESNDEADCDEYSGLITGEITEEAQVFTLPSSLAEAGGPSHVKYWRNPSGSTYDVGFDIYWQAGVGQYQPGLQLQVSKKGQTTGKGTMTFFPRVAVSEESMAKSVVTVFEASQSEKVLDLRTYFESDNSITPSVLGMKLIEVDGIITGAGSAIRSAQAEDEGRFAPFQTKGEFAFVYNLVGDAKANIGLEKLAAVPLDSYEVEDSYFTTYGLDGLLRSFATDLLRGTIGAYDCALHGQQISNALPTNICKSQTGVTDEQVLDGFKIFCANAANSSNKLCELAGTFDRWTNPIYLDGDGYVGNASYQTPSDVGYQPLLEKLDDIAVYSPVTLKAATEPTAPAAVSTVK